MMVRRHEVELASLDSKRGVDELQVVVVEFVRRGWNDICNAPCPYQLARIDAVHLVVHADDM